ncbi:hypothetical protein BH23GEM5_BH23GEM5_20280 [soil metagenome]
MGEPIFGSPTLFSVAVASAAPPAAAATPFVGVAAAIAPLASAAPAAAPPTTALSPATAVATTTTPAPSPPSGLAATVTSTATAAAATSPVSTTAPTVSAARSALFPAVARATFRALRNIEPDDVGCFEALGLFHDVELDPLILVQGTHTGAPNRTVMHEYIGSLFLLDETEAFLLGEPLHRSHRACHWSVPCVSERVSCVLAAQR